MVVVDAAALAAVSVSSLPGIPLFSGVHRRNIGPSRALSRGVAESCG